jgi:hypothetical protein
MNDQQLDQLLRALAAATTVPSHDAMEHQLLRALTDAQPARPPRARRSLAAWWPAAALLLLSTGLLWPLARTPRFLPEQGDDEFVALPTAASLPELESGRIVRVELPVSALPAYGLAIIADTRGAIEADLLVGQDGVPRAIRLAPHR